MVNWIVHIIGLLAGVDTDAPYWWLSEDKRQFLLSTTPNTHERSNTPSGN